MLLTHTCADENRSTWECAPQALCQQLYWVKRDPTKVMYNKEGAEEGKPQQLSASLSDVSHWFIQDITKRDSGWGRTS